MLPTHYQGKCGLGDNCLLGLLISHRLRQTKRERTRNGTNDKGRRRKDKGRSTRKRRPKRQKQAAERQIPGYLYMEAAISRFTPASFDAASAAMCALDTTDRLSSIDVPALVVATPDDPGAPREVSEKMARLIPNCELKWLEPAQHLASLEHPARFNQLIKEFLTALR